MAFENGYNMFDYCQKIFIKYQNDNLIFYKALQLLEYFRGRNDYPYCTDEISKVLERILGENLDVLTDSLWKYSTILSEEMEWDIQQTEMNLQLPEEEVNDLAEKFKNDMEAFFIATTPFFEELFVGETNTNSIKKIALKHTYGNEKVVRFIRNDGQSFDFSVDEKDIQKIIDVFSGMK